MACKYSGYTWYILLGMVVSGSARSVVVKLIYQSGCNAPLTITLLYLLGQSLSVVVYALQNWLANNNDYIVPSVTKDDVKHLEGGSFVISRCVEKRVVSVINCDVEENTGKRNCGETDSVQSGWTTPLSVSERSSPPSLSACSSSLICLAACAPPYENDDESIGSKHGLSSDSKERTKWANQVPFCVKPAIPAILNLMNSALRWSALTYIDASVAEMMISGLELTLVVVASRIFRKRIVATSRWVGIIIVAAGVIIIERANNIKSMKSQSSDDGSRGNLDSGTPDVMIGVFLIVLQSMLSALQDIGEEIFIQATNFPATLFLGMEGLYGFSVGLVLYLSVGNQLGMEDIGATMSMLTDNANMRWWFVGLPFLFLLTGLFNIKATETTSAMTRNVWKNLRTVLVWAIALGCFYLGNNAYGEAWHTPESFIILLGFMVMVSGIIVYYWFKEQEQPESLLAEGHLV